MARKAFLLRLDPKVLDALQSWASDDLRSLNGQIEYILREALQKRTKAELLSNEETDEDTTKD